MQLASTMPRPFVDWKMQVDDQSATSAEFEKWLFVSIASVLFGGKAGELLALTATHFGLSMSEQIARVTALAEHWGVSVQVMHQNQSTATTKVIIYNERKVREVLTAVSPCVLTCELNYAHGLQPADFLAEVARRWHERGEIPHEIGLALGYPIKDVLGYMGVLPLQCTGSCGWRIYGDPADSLTMSRAFIDARHRAIAFLYARG